MAFKIEGTIEVSVVEAYVQECRFQPQPNEVNNRNEYVQCYYDVVLLVQDAQGNNDAWHGEISNRTGVGNYADKYRYDMTLATLQDIGFNVTTIQELEQQFQPAADRTICIPNLIGLKCKVVTENRTFTKRDGTEGQAIRIKYLNGLNSDAGGKRFNFDEFMAARRGVAPAAPAAPAPTPAPAAPAAAPAPGYPPQGYAQPATTAPMPPPAAPAPAPAVPPPAPAAPAAPKPGCPY